MTRWVIRLRHLDFPFLPDSGNPPYLYDSTDSLSMYTVSVPEPGSLVLVGLGGMSLLALARRRRASR